MKRNLATILLSALLIILLILPVQAAAQLNYVTDDAGVLGNTERHALEDLCDNLSQQYGCGVYIVTLGDFRDFGSGDVFDVTYSIYHDYELGMGPDRNGLILLLSVSTRDFALYFYGDRAEYAFDAYGQEALDKAFLPYLLENDWYGGLNAYAQTAGSMLAAATAGRPVRETPTKLILLSIGISFLVSLLVVSLLKIGMKNVQRQPHARQYLSGGLNLTGRVDQFTHRTETRRRIESSSGGSTVRSGGGGSGRSGKF